jgi:hypothetical protein
MVIDGYSVSSRNGGIHAVSGWDVASSGLPLSQIAKE